MFRLFFNNLSKKNSLGQLLRTSQKMYSQTATELNKLSNNEVKAWLESFDTVLTDCDGKLILKLTTHTIIRTIFVIRSFMDVQQCHQWQSGSDK